MPELPEVETVCSGLRSTTTGCTINQVLIHNRKLRLLVPEQLQEVCIGSTITSVCRRAKYIIMQLSNSYAVIFHLGMTGKLLIHNANEYTKTKHDHVVFVLNNKLLVYNDVRRFGLVTYEKQDKITDNVLFRSLGVEPLTTKFNSQYLYDKLKNKRSPIKVNLMNSNIVVGVGNIYACETLFLSNISPLRPANQCSTLDLNNLVNNVRKVLNDAIMAGGSTLRDYKNVESNSGYFQHCFKVYGRLNQACFVCSSPIIRIKQAGRSSFYCSLCQSA